MIWFPVLLFSILIFLGCTYIPREKLSIGFFCASVMTLVSAFLVCFLYSFIKNGLPLGESEKGIYIHYLIHDHIFFFYPAVLTVCLGLLPWRKSASRIELLAKSFVLFALFMFMAILSKFYYCQHSWWGDPYIVFIMPQFMLLYCILFSLLYQVSLKIAAFSYLCAVPLVIAAISAFYYTNRVELAWIALASCYVLILLLAFFLFKSWRKV